MFLDPFLCNFMRPKTSDKLSVNINHVFCSMKINIETKGHDPIKTHIKRLSKEE